MLRRIWLVVAFFLPFFLLIQQARAAEINSTNYTIYSGDVNGDGMKDFVFSAKQKLLILHGDISTPIEFVKNIDLIVYRDGTGYSSPVMLTLTSADIAARVLAGSLTLLQSNSHYFTWKNGTSNQSNLLLRGADATAPGLLLTSYADIAFPAVAQIYSPERFEGISTSTVKLTIVDNNGDGLKDIFLEDQTVAAWKTAYLASSVGVPIAFKEVVASTTRPTITPVTKPAEGSTAVGFTPYTAGVNHKGEATISIPVQVPQGINGMQPQLSLNFNSGGVASRIDNQTSSGWLSFGWSLSGISSINRCTLGLPEIPVPASTDPYAKMRPFLKYNDEDRLCLNGELLVLVSGTHFQPGAQYHTDTESYKLVTIKSDGANTWFEVKNPNGSTVVYGKTEESRIRKITTANGTTYTPYFEWYINTETDSFGNQIVYEYPTSAPNSPSTLLKDESFSYQPNKTRIFPAAISYRDVRVVFDYFAVAPNAGVAYPDYGASIGIDRWGYGQNFSHQLAGIRIQKSTSGSDRSYSIVGMTNSTLKDFGLQPVSVQECAFPNSGGPSCLPPLTFSWASYQSCCAQVLRLLGIVDSLGASTTFEYSEITSNSTYALPFPSRPTSGWPLESNPLKISTKESRGDYVVSKLKKSTGLSATDIHTLDYSYRSLSTKSTIGMGSLGFRDMRITDTLSGIVTYKQYDLYTDYDTYQLRGSKLAATYQYDGLYDPATAGTKLISKSETRHDYVPLTGFNTYLPIVRQITNLTYEKGVLVGGTVKTNTYSLNSSGYITQILSKVISGNAIEAVTGEPSIFWGRNALYKITDGATKTSEVTTTVFTNSTQAADWRIGFTASKEKVMYNGVIGSAADQKTQKASYTAKAGTMAIAQSTLFDGDSENQLTSTFSYDSRGRQISMTTTGANIAETTITTDSFATVNSITPGQVTNPLGHIISNSNIDNRFDQPKTVTDANGLVSKQEFDVFGRVIMATDVNGVSTTQVYKSCASVSCDTVAGKLGVVTPSYYKEIISPISPTVREYFDSLNRVIRSETQGFSAGEWIRTDTQYNEQGRVHKSSLPYKTGSTPQYITTTYDKFGRLTDVLQPDGGSLQTVYDTATGSDGYMQLRAVITESIKKADTSAAGSQQKTRYTNGAGQLTKVIDSAGTTSFEYDALGNISKTTVDGGADGVTLSTAIFDNAGNRISITDPNSGTITSRYTALGKLRWQQDNKGNITTFTYDKLGRVLTRASIDGTSNWFYDPIGAKGNLWYTTNNNGYKQTYFYEDNYRAARLSRIETTISVLEAGLLDKTFTDYVHYDIYGRIKKTVSPSGFSATQNFNAQGYLSAVNRGDSSYSLQAITQMGAFGVEDETFAGGSNTQRSYDANSGRIKSIKTLNAGSKIQDLSYQWRSNGSMETRTNSKPSVPVVDKFSYDQLDRLTTTDTTINNAIQRTLTQTYSNLGNIKSNISSQVSDSQVSGYQYGGNAGPHALTAATINGIAYTLSYDQNGAIERYDAAGTTPDKFIAYNAANQPIKITLGTSLGDASPIARDEFRYTPDGARYYKKTTYKEGSTLRTEHTFYIGNYETTYYDSLSALKQSEKSQLGSAILNIRKTPYSGLITDSVQVLHRDHLGSVDAVTDGTVKIADLAFEPFGARRSSGLLSNISTTDMTNLLAKSPALNSQGYTGHESLDRTGLIHMNGRVYDPQLGRFLSPDPLVQAPTNSQSWNRYSYVFNNPLKYTDPSGFVAKEDCSSQAECADTITVTGRRERSSGGGGSGGESSGGGQADANSYVPKTDEPTTKGLIQESVSAIAAGNGPGCEDAESIICSLMEDERVDPDIRQGMAPNPRVVVLMAAAASKAIADNIKRFMKKIPANSKDNIDSHELPNGGVAIQATSPASKVPGSKAVYEKQIDQNGVTVQSTKTTYDPQGNIVHVKDKLNP